MSDNHKSNHDSSEFDRRLSIQSSVSNYPFEHKPTLPEEIHSKTIKVLEHVLNQAEFV